MTPTARLAAVLALRVELRDDDACARITPEAANTYLAARGFQRFDTDTWHVWALGDAQIVIPRHLDWPDRGSAMRRAIAAIAEHEGRSPLAVWLDLVDPRGAVRETPGTRFQTAAATPVASADLTPVQGALPGLAAPAKVRRSAQHRFGLLRWETAPATEIVPEHPVALATCAHCKTVRRRANTGRRLGAKDTYSTDGQTWSAVSPPCVMKRR